MADEEEPDSSQQLSVIRDFSRPIPISFSSLDALESALDKFSINQAYFTRNNYDKSVSFCIRGKRGGFEALRIYLDGVVLENIDFIRRASDESKYNEIRNFIKEKGFTNFYNPEEQGEKYSAILNERFEKELGNDL